MAKLKRAKRYLKGGHLSFSFKGLTYQAFSSRGKKLPADFSMKMNKTKGVEYFNTLQLPKGTKKVKVLYKGRVINSHEYEKALTKKRSLGVTGVARLTQTSVSSPLGSVDVRERIEDTLGAGSFTRIESGYLPNSPHFKSGVFFKAESDYGIPARNFRVYMAVKGESYKDKEGAAADAFHIVSLPYPLGKKGAMRPATFAKHIEAQAFDDMEEIVRDHNIRLKNKSVKTRWFGGSKNMRFLGVEAVD